MSSYRKYAQGSVKQGDFKLTGDNIEEYLQYAREMYRDIHQIDTICDLRYKLAHPETVDDELYTPEYLQARLRKTEGSLNMTDDISAAMELRNRLTEVNRDIDKVRPLVFHQELGKDPEVHERMSILDDERKSLEEGFGDIFRVRYAALLRDLPKIFYIILDGVDFDNVEQCFRMMRNVLCNGTSYENAMAGLAQMSSDKYKLPQGFWDPIFNGKAGRAYRAGPPQAKK